MRRVINSKIILILLCLLLLIISLDRTVYATPSYPPIDLKDVYRIVIFRSYNDFVLAIYQDKACICWLNKAEDIVSKGFRYQCSSLQLGER